MYKQAHQYTEKKTVHKFIQSDSISFSVADKGRQRMVVGYFIKFSQDFKTTRNFHTIKFKQVFYL